MSRETDASMKGVVLSREARLVLLKLDLADCTEEMRFAIKEKTAKAIEYNKEMFAKQNANGMNLPQSVLDRNNARHLLVLEALSAK